MIVGMCWRIRGRDSGKSLEVDGYIVGKILENGGFIEVKLYIPLDFV